MPIKDSSCLWSNTESKANTFTSGLWPLFAYNEWVELADCGLFTSISPLSKFTVTTLYEKYDEKIFKPLFFLDTCSVICRQFYSWKCLICTSHHSWPWLSSLLLIGRLLTITLTLSEQDAVEARLVLIWLEICEADVGSWCWNLSSFSSSLSSSLSAWFSSDSSRIWVWSRAPEVSGPLLRLLLLLSSL